MTLKSRLTLLALMLLLPILLLTGCASASPTLTAAPAALIPPLPERARQPVQGTECLPKTCSQGFSTWLDATLPTQTLPAAPGSPASAPTAH